MENIKIDFQKHIDAGRCNGAEWIINYENKVYHDVIGYKDLDLNLIKIRIIEFGQ